MELNKRDFDFDQQLTRKGTGSRKWDDTGRVFGSSDVLPLWIADMDFATPPGIVAAVAERAQHPFYAYNAYDASFYEAAVKWVKKRHQWDIAAEWIVQSPGVVPAIVVSILALSEPGDGVIIQPPVYPPFFASIKDNTRTIVENPLQVKDGRYEMDLADLEVKLADPKNKLLLLCSPHNPVGRVWTEAELKAVAVLCQKYEVTVLADEIHSDLVYQRQRHYSFANLGESVNKASVTFMAASKTFNIAGLNTAYMIIPCSRRRALIEQELNNLHLSRNNLFGVLATSAAYNTSEGWLEAVLCYLEQNADFLVKYVAAELPKVKVVKPEGTYLAWLDFRAYFTEQKALDRFLVEIAKVGLNSGSAFGAQGIGFARLNFATQRSVLEEALTRIKTGLDSL